MCFDNSTAEDVCAQRSFPDSRPPRPASVAQWRERPLAEREAPGSSPGGGALRAWCALSFPGRPTGRTRDSDSRNRGSNPCQGARPPHTACDPAFVQRVARVGTGRRLFRTSARGPIGRGTGPRSRRCGFDSRRAYAVQQAAMAQPVEASRSGREGQGSNPCGGTRETTGPSRRGRRPGQGRLAESGIAPVSKTEARVAPAGVRIPHLPPEKVTAQ